MNVKVIIEKEQTNCNLELGSGGNLRSSMLQSGLWIVLPKKVYKTTYIERAQDVIPKVQPSSDLRF